MRFTLPLSALSSSLSPSICLVVSVVISVVTSLPPLGRAQTEANTAPTNLELRIKVESVLDTVPQALQISLTNISDHDVHLPEPAALCGDTAHGTFRLGENFVPLHGSASTMGGGCFRDFGYQPILERVKGWKVLRPGESLVVFNDHIPAQAPGSYDYWGVYLPPGMPGADADVLRKDGIAFPTSRLESGHVHFTVSEKRGHLDR